MTVAKTNNISPLDPNAAVPFYRQIYERFRTAIASGLLKPGDRIPSARALTKELGLARGTIETAYSLLAAEGYIEAHGQAGTIVTPGLKTLTPAAPPFLQPKTSEAEVSFVQTRFCHSRWDCLPSMHFPERSGPASARGAFEPCNHPIWYILPYTACRRCVPRSRISTGFARYRLLTFPGIRDFGVSSHHRIDCAHPIEGRKTCVWLEDPGYPPTREILRHMNIVPVPVRVDREGNGDIRRYQGGPPSAGCCRHACTPKPAERVFGIARAWHCWTGRRETMHGSLRTTMTASIDMSAALFLR